MSRVWRNQTWAGMQFVYLGDNLEIQVSPYIVQWKDSGAQQDYS